MADLALRNVAAPASNTLVPCAAVGPSFHWIFSFARAWASFETASFRARSRPRSASTCFQTAARVSPSLSLMASQVSDAYATKTRVNPDAVWTDALLPPKAELNILPPAKK